MPTVEWNRGWNRSALMTTDAGESWSEKWGGSESQWFGSLYPRLHRFLPAPTILEIAPGYGRWTQYLLKQCRSYVGIDLNEGCVRACEQRFAGVEHAKFHVNDGLSIAVVPDGTVDLAFSFDSLVHVEAQVMESYVVQLIDKLSAEGVAFLHHSNLAATKLADTNADHGRGANVSAALVEQIVKAAGGKTLVQEIVNWVDTGMIDCFTTFCRPTAYPDFKSVLLENPNFMKEADLIKTYQARYAP